MIFELYLKGYTFSQILRERKPSGHY
ncbi:MAG: hypothetical protein SPG10_14815 [Enterocloster clostridioformis]|nr:hypothetical protein [Enterocloster clostridioformis]